MVAKTESKDQVQIKPEDVLTPNEASVLQLAKREELPCPRCGQPLCGEKVIVEGVYEGVMLTCLVGCGFREY